MNFKFKLIASLCVLGLLVGIYFREENSYQKSVQQQEERSVALHFAIEDCTQFSMQNQNGVFTFKRENAQSVWQMISPKNVIANQEVITSLLRQLGTIPVQKVLAPDNLQNFGLQNSTLKFEITLSNNLKKVLTFGDQVNDKSERFRLPSAYAQNSTREEILVVDNSSIEFFQDKKYEDLRTKQILHFSLSDIVNIKLNTPTETIQLGQYNQGWQIQSPLTTKADHAFVIKYLEILQSLNAQNVIEPENVNEFLQTNHLENKSAAITFQNINQKEQTTSVYLLKSGLFMTMEDGALAQIDLSLWPEIIPKFKFFRDRTLMLGANFVCEPPLQNIVAEDILDNVSEADLKKFGLAPPAQKFSCQTSHKKTSEINIITGDHVPFDEKNVYVKRSDSNNVYIVDAELLSTLAQLK